MGHYIKINKHLVLNKDVRNGQISKKIHKPHYDLKASQKDFFSWTSRAEIASMYYVCPTPVQVVVIYTYINILEGQIQKKIYMHKRPVCSISRTSGTEKIPKINNFTKYSRGVEI